MHSYNVLRVFWIRIHINWFGSNGEQKWPTKLEKKGRNFKFLSARCSLLRAEGFSCSLDVLYVGLGYSKLQFLIKKILIFCPSVNYFQCLVIWIRTNLKCWIRIRNETNAENIGSQHTLKFFSLLLKIIMTTHSIVEMCISLRTNTYWGLPLTIVMQISHAFVFLAQQYLKGANLV